MTLDIAFIAENAGLLIAILAFCCFWAAYDRLILGWGAVILFCAGEYGWALLVFWIWSMAEHQHRLQMAIDRAGRFYNGPWID